MGEKGFLEGEARPSNGGVWLQGRAGHVGDVLARQRVDLWEGEQGGGEGLRTSKYADPVPDPLPDLRRWLTCWRPGSSGTDSSLRFAAGDIEGTFGAEVAAAGAVMDWSALSLSASKTELAQVRWGEV